MLILVLIKNLLLKDILANFKSMQYLQGDLISRTDMYNQSFTRSSKKFHWDFGLIRGEVNKRTAFEKKVHLGNNYNIITLLSIIFLRLLERKKYN